MNDRRGVGRVAWHKRESVMDRLGAQMRLTAWGVILSGNPNANARSVTFQRAMSQIMGQEVHPAIRVTIFDQPFLSSSYFE